MPVETVYRIVTYYTLLNFSTDSPVEDTTYPLNLSMISSQGKFEDKTIFDV